MPFGELERRLELAPGTISDILRQKSRRGYLKMKVRRKGAFIAPSRREPKIREVFKPSVDLNDIQIRIREILLADFTPHAIAHAYTKGRSIITNASAHLGASSMLHIDLVDFFGSIKRPTVREALRKFLVGFKSIEIDALAELCCYDGFLPQGAPISPILSNLVCRLFDEELQDLALSFGCSVGRYGDDITFSTKAAVFPHELAEISGCSAFPQIRLGDALCASIERHGFEINFKKVRYETRSGRMRVTGLSVGGRVAVPAAFRRAIRAILHNWERDGIVATAQAHSPDKTNEEFAQALRSCIAYVGQVMGRDNLHYRKFLTSFTALSARDRGRVSPARNVTAIA